MRQQMFDFSEFWSLPEEKETNNSGFAKRRKRLLPSSVFCLPSSVFRLLSSVRIDGGGLICKVVYFWPVVEWGGAMRYEICK